MRGEERSALFTEAKVAEQAWDDALVRLREAKVMTLPGVLARLDCLSESGEDDCETRSWCRRDWPSGGRISRWLDRIKTGSDGERAAFGSLFFVGSPHFVGSPETPCAARWRESVGFGLITLDVASRRQKDSREILHFLYKSVEMSKRRDVKFKNG